MTRLTPSSEIRKRLRLSPRLTLGIQVGLLLTTGGQLCAGLEDLVRVSPVVKALDQRVASARELAGAAGLFPDPRVEVMAARGSNSGGSSWPKWEGRVEQPLPKAGERQADRERAWAEIFMAEAERAVMAGSMAAEVAMAMAESGAASERAALLKLQLTRMEKVLALVENRLAGGQGQLADRLALQSRIAEMKLMIEEDERMAADSLLLARGMLGLGPLAELPLYAAPNPERVQPMATPLAMVALAKESEARAMALTAKANGRPMTAIGLSASRETMPMETEDMVGISFMMEIPFHSQKASRAGQNAAEANRNAARADAAAARFRAETAVARVKRARQWADSARQLAEGTMARLDAEYETVIKMASAEGMKAGSSVLMLIELLEKRVESGIRVIDAEAAARTSAAALWEHVFVTPVSTQFQPPVQP